MTRSAESIAFIIVEGCGANSPKEFARFLDIGIKSTTELEYQLDLARDYGVLAEREWKSLRAQTTDVRRMLWGLRAKVQASIPAKSANG
jgi:four helix bundle protein